MRFKKILLLGAICGQVSCSGYLAKHSSDDVSPAIKQTRTLETLTPELHIPPVTIVAEPPVIQPAPVVVPVSEKKVVVVPKPVARQKTAIIQKPVVVKPSAVSSQALKLAPTVISKQPTAPIAPVIPTTVSAPPVIAPAIIPVKSSVEVKTTASKLKTPEIAKPAIVQEPVVELVKDIPVVKLGAVQGKVKLLGKNSEVLSAKETIITLEPLFTLPKIAHVQKTYNIEMQNKHYSPSVLVINAGDKVMFNNKDTIKHNVFSSSGNNSFDLGTYGKGVKEEVKLVHPGIVKVYCNIHVEMATFIAIDDNSFTFVTKDDGKFTFDHLPVGEYILQVWSVRGEAKKRITVTDGKTLPVDIAVQSVSYQPTAHLNKFGQSYKVKPALFQDEFY